MNEDGVPFLRPVEPGELRHTWAQIRDRVKELAERWGEPWVPEDVFHEILVGNSHLWALDDLSGFVIFRVFATNYERVLFVWIAHNSSEPKVADYLPQIVSIAEVNECDRVQFVSPRKYHRALPSARVTYTYSIEVGGTDG